MLKNNAEKLAYDKLKDAIYKRKIKPRTRLVESRIAEQLGLSRTPVRSAIRKLAHEGFVSIFPNRGAEIVKPTEKEIRDTFAVRTTLETMAAQETIKRITPEEINQLLSLLSREKDSFNCRDIGTYYEFNYNFHLSLARCAGNAILTEYVSTIINRSQIYLILYEDFYEMENNPSYSEHLKIIEAINKGDKNQCRQIIAEHMQTTMRGLKFESENLELPDDLNLL